MREKSPTVPAAVQKLSCADNVDILAHRKNLVLVGVMVTIKADFGTVLLRETAVKCCQKYAAAFGPVSSSRSVAVSAAPKYLVNKLLATSQPFLR